MLDPNLGSQRARPRMAGMGRTRPVPEPTHRAVDIMGFELRIPLALITVIIFQAWRYFPFAFLFILARLQALPAEPEEAAKVDGAAPIQRFRYVILPQLAASSPCSPCSASSGRSTSSTTSTCSRAAVAARRSSSVTNRSTSSAGAT